jgi:hypothetical protein
MGRKNIGTPYSNTVHLFSVCPVTEEVASEVQVFWSIEDLEVLLTDISGIIGTLPKT